MRRGVAGWPLGRPRADARQPHACRTVGFLGIQANTRTYVRLGFSEAVSMAASKTWGTITDTVHDITQALTSGRGTQTFAGVLGIAQLAGQRPSPATPERSCRPISR